MTRWRIVELVPGNVVPPRVAIGLELVLDDRAGDDVVELVEFAASGAGVTLERLTATDERTSLNGHRRC